MKSYAVTVLATLATGAFAQFLNPGSVADAESNLTAAQTALATATAEFENSETNVVRAQDALQEARAVRDGARAARSEAQRTVNEAQTRLRRANDLEKRAADRGISVADLLEKTFRQEAEYVKMAYEDWLELDMPARQEKFKERAREIQAENYAKDSAAAEAAGLSVDEYRARRKAEQDARRLANEAKLIGVTVEEWTALDADTRRARLNARYAEIKAENEARKAAQAAPAETPAPAEAPAAEDAAN